MNSLMGLLKQFPEPASFRQGRQQSCNQGTSQRMSLDNCSHSHLGMSFSSLFHYTLYPLLNTSTFALEVGNAQQPVYRRPCTVNLLYSIWSLSSCSGTIGQIKQRLNIKKPKIVFSKQKAYVPAWQSTELLSFSNTEMIAGVIVLVKSDFLTQTGILKYMCQGFISQENLKLQLNITLEYKIPFKQEERNFEN